MKKNQIKPGRISSQFEEIFPMRCLKTYRSSVRKLTSEIQNKSSECNCVNLYNFENCVDSISSDIV